MAKVARRNSMHLTGMPNRSRPLLSQRKKMAKTLLPSNAAVDHQSIVPPGQSLIGSNIGAGIRILCETRLAARRRRVEAILSIIVDVIKVNIVADEMHRSVAE